MPSRPLLKLTGPGRHGQKCRHPEVSVHSQCAPEAWDGWWWECWQLDRSVSWTLLSGERSWCQNRPRSQTLQSHSPARPGPSTGLAVTRTRVSSRASSSESLSAKTCSLFLPNYVQDKYLLQLLRSADDVSNWVAAEIVTSHTSKVGASEAPSSEQGLGSDCTASGPPEGSRCPSPRTGGGGVRRPSPGHQR